MTPNEREHCRLIGIHLSATLHQRRKRYPPTSELQALVADLIGDQTELLLPVKDLVSRPGFQALIVKADSGTGAVESRALVDDLKRTFAPAVVAALEELLNGFLHLPINSAPPSEAGAAHVDPAAQDPQQAGERQRIETPAKGVTTPTSQRSPSQAVHPLVLALTVCIAAATLLAIGTTAVRNPWICSAIGLCPANGPSESVQQILEAARQAVADLEAATNWRDYRRASVILDRELQKLRSASLTPEQRRLEQELTSISRKAQAAVVQDEADQDHLERAAAALAAARKSEGPEQRIQIAAAERALLAISVGGFASAEATRLKEALRAFQSEQTSAPGEQRPEVQPLPPPQPRSSVPAGLPPAVPRTSPSAPRSAAPEPDTNTGGGWRDQPLF